MSNVLGVVATAVNTAGVLNKVVQGLINGRVKVNLDSYTADGTEAAASTIKMGAPLLSGAKVIGVIVSVSGAIASLTIDVGDSNDPNRYGDALTAFQSAANQALAALVPGYEVGQATGDDQLLLTTAGATLTAGRVIRTAQFFTTD